MTQAQAVHKAIQRSRQTNRDLVVIGVPDIELPVDTFHVVSPQYLNDPEFDATFAYVVCEVDSTGSTYW